MQLTGHTVIYGGSFNPPHLAHQMACLYLLEGLGAEAVWLVPTFEHPFGKQLAAWEHRVAMCVLTAAALSGRVLVSEVEKELGGVSRSYDTLVHLRAQQPERPLALAIGADILGEVDKWYRWRDIEAMVPVVIIGRAGFDGAGRTGLELPRVSSTELRARAGRGESLVGLVPQSVAHYIETQRLYR